VIKVQVIEDRLQEEFKGCHPRRFGIIELGGMIGCLSFKSCKLGCKQSSWGATWNHFEIQQLVICFIPLHETLKFVNSSISFAFNIFVKSSYFVKVR